MTKGRLLLALFIALCGSHVLAQSPSDAPATRDDILKLFNTMNIRNQMTLVLESVSKQQRSMIHDAMRKRFPQVTDQELAKLDQMSADIMKDLPIDGMLDDMVPVYQKHLSKADVNAMSAFYASPTGQKLLREMPEMTAESMQAAGPRIQVMMDKVMERAQKIAQEDKEKQESPRPATQKN